MPWNTVKLLPGVHVEQTPLLLQAGIAQSNNIRFRDGLPEKLGGWGAFLGTPDTVPGVTRELWAWADNNSVRHLAIGGDKGVRIFTPVLADGTQNEATIDVTPQYQVTNEATFSTNPSSGSGPFTTTITINDAALGPDGTTLHGSVVIETQIAIGGIILFGAYAITAIHNPTSVDITIPVAPTSAGANVHQTATYATAAGTEIVTVTLTEHGLQVRGTYLAAVATTLTGSGATSAQDLTVTGAYDVLTVPDANTFTIGLPNAAANGVGPIAQNGGNAQLLWWLVPGPSQKYAGWGNPAWGVGGWGTGVAPPAIAGTPITSSTYPWTLAPTEAFDWCFANFGEDLIMQAEGGPFFTWDPDKGLGAGVSIPTAPQSATGFFIAMPEQQVVAYGAAIGASGVPDPMLVSWCDNADYTTWVPAVNNQAGDYRLTRGSRIVGGLQGPQQALLWTDVGLWLMQYIGYPDVYGFNEIAQGCGLIAKKAAGVVSGRVYWMSLDGFWMYAGAAPQRIPCDVWDVLFQNLCLGINRNHIRCAPHSNMNEIAWHFPSSVGYRAATGAIENDMYVKLNVVTGEWDYGYISGAAGQPGITEWIDANVFGEPLSAMPSIDPASGGDLSTVMQHETLFDPLGAIVPERDANGQPLHWWFTTGLFLLAEGEEFLFIDRMFPDMKWKRFPDLSSGPARPGAANAATIKVTLYGYRWPEAAPDTFGPFPMTAQSNEVDPRARGRYFALKIEGDDVGTFVRLGAFKFRAAPDGRN